MRAEHGRFPSRHGPALRGVVATAALLVPALASSAPLTVAEAIRGAWQQNPGLAAGQGLATAARADADAARDALFPKLILTARAVATDEPVAAFGLRLDEQRIAQADFAPARLNAPDPVGGVGLGAALVQPVYTGGRLSAARRAAARQAEAEESAQDRRRQELAFHVVQAYFATAVAAEGLRYADDVLEQARETERFVRARNEKGLVLDADVARATAFRAQAEAEREGAAQRLATARSTLALLAGDDAGQSELTSPLASPATAAAAAPPAAPAARPDVEAARLRAGAAEETIAAVRGSLLPEVTAQGAVETMRSAIDQGATWFSVALVARWKLDVADLRSTRAAEARAGAAALALRWQERQARQEVDEARRAVEAADARVRSAREAVTASESARTLRQARHRQGLLPLTDVLDAEAGLAGARALLLRSELEARVARAQLELARGAPIEGVES